MKGLISGSANKSDIGNCIWDDSISLLVHQPTLQVAIDETTDEYDLQENLSVELREKTFFLIDFKSILKGQNVYTT